MQPRSMLPLTGWINWFFVLIFGPLIAFVLSDACGFKASAETFQTILLAEVCLVASGVVVLLLVRALGPLTESEALAREGLRLPTAAPGSVLEEATLRPAVWNRRIQSYLRAAWTDAVAHQPRDVEFPASLLDPNWTSSAPVEPLESRVRPRPLERSAGHRPEPAATMPGEGHSDVRRPAPGQRPGGSSHSPPQQQGRRRPPKPPRR